METDKALSQRGLAPLRGRRFLALLAILLCVGAVSTSLWVGAVQFPSFRSHVFSLPAVLSALVCALFTFVNVMTRWFRWHFLIRRFTPHLITRDSLAVYLATLPAIITPFFLGELVRVFLIRRRFHTPASYLVRIWLAERLLDFGVLASALLLSLDWRSGLLGVPALIGGLLLLFGRVLRTQPLLTVTGVSAATLSISVLAWSLPVIALWLTLQLFSSPISLDTALRTFTAGTLFGGLTGLPLGVFVTGSTMIRELMQAGVSTQNGVLAILVYRAGTAWFAVGLGLVSLVIFRRRLLRMVRGEAEVHFDEIASEYEGEIPAHVRDRLLNKKVALMDRTLSEHGIPRGARGLDLGCGQGWYLYEMTKRGYRVDGTDYSQGQLDKADVHLQHNGVSGAKLVQADAAALPFADASYDFVYSINAIHHMLAPGAQKKALAEIARVLRPGGVFMLHEINTNNPVFRWYMGYLFPLLKKIDEGNEEWLPPSALPPVPGASWARDDVQYFTFLPDFVPGRVLAWFAWLEEFLERSRLRRFSAHYQACLVKQRGNERSPAASSAS